MYTLVYTSPVDGFTFPVGGRTFTTLYHVRQVQRHVRDTYGWMWEIDLAERYPQLVETLAA